MGRGEVWAGVRYGRGETWAGGEIRAGGEIWVEMWAGGEIWAG